MSARTAKAQPKLLNPCKTGHHAGCRGHHYYEVTIDRGDPAKGVEPKIDQRFEVCGCACHAEGNPPRCQRCNSTEPELAGAFCADSDACDIALAEALDNDPTMAKLRLAHERALATRRDEDSPPSVRRERKATETPKTGRCEHCGSPTKGGRFTVGHDAKLKGELKRAAEAGELDALIELAVRNWPTHTAKVTDDFRRQAELATPQNTKTWLAARVTNRIGEQ